MSAQRHQERVKVEDLAQLSGWQIAQALRLKLEQCPEQGRRGQMLNCLDTLVRSGGAWLLAGSFDNAESKTVHV